MFVGRNCYNVDMLYIAWRKWRNRRFRGFGPSYTKEYRVRGGVYRARGGVYRWLGVSYTLCLILEDVKYSRDSFVVHRFDENQRLIPASMFIVACGGHDQTVSKAVAVL